MPSSIEIYNVLGQSVLNETLPCLPTGRVSQEDNLINLNGKPSGVYFYRVLKEDGSLAGDGKIIIQK